MESGLTLLELLIVIAIIAILVGLLIPAILAARKSSHLAACDNNIRQITLAAQHYMDATRGCFPLPAVPERPSGWAVALLPFMEEASLADLLDYTRPLTVPRNLAVVREHRPSVFLCPAVPELTSTIAGVGVTHYVVVINDKDRVRPLRSRSWIVKDAPAGSRFPWCTSPEILSENAGYPPPHPSAYSIFESK